MSKSDDAHSEDIGVTSFREYLKINTMHPNPNYDKAVSFLERLASDLGLTSKIVTVAPGNPVVVMTWLGEKPSVPSICLNSHMDVVPVFREHWKHDPFGGYKDENGNIYGRGAQDMKCVGIQYLEAIRRLKKRNVKLQRTVHVTFVPDEEVGGGSGMNLFVRTPEFREMNVGFGLDEGLADPSPEYMVFHAERVKWWFKVICTGDVGHGSGLIDNTAAEKFQKVINTFLSLREEHYSKLKTDPSLSIGDVITINLTMVSGGVQVNVIPTDLTANFDIRVPPTYNLQECKHMFEKLATDSGPGVKFEWAEFDGESAATELNDKNIFWKVFSETMTKLRIPFRTRTFPGGTDGRYLRKCGIPVLGFSPMTGTPRLLHEHNEYLNEVVFLKGVDIYTHMIADLANLTI